VEFTAPGIKNEVGEGAADVAAEVAGIRHDDRLL
jgi:hypothetical protein